MAEVFAWSDDLGAGTVIIMNTPLAVRKNRGVCVASDVLFFSGLREGCCGNRADGEEVADMHV